MLMRFRRTTSDRILITCSWALSVFVAAAVFAAGTATAEPDLNGGVWVAVNPSQTLKTIDGKTPSLLPRAKAKYAKHAAALKAGDRSFDPAEKCVSPGVPRIVQMSPFEFVQQRDAIAILYQWNHRVRMIYMNKPQTKVLFNSEEGQSVGKWQDGSLVVDSVGFDDVTLLDAAGLPHSDELHVIEKYTPSLDGQSMKVRFTVDDPKTFKTSWQTELELRRVPDGSIEEDICVESRRVNWGSLNKDF